MQASIIKNNLSMKKGIILIILSFASFSIQANTFYVTTNGNDANAGTETQPWRTIQKAANTLIAGDTVFVKGGVYNERVIVENSGLVNNYIVFSAYQEDAVYIDGNGISWGGSWNGLFDISDKSYIQIIGFNLSNADYAGIWVENSDHIIINENFTYNTFSSGIGVWNSSYVTVENNEIELACNDGEQECITIANSNNCTIKSNNVHDNGMGTNGGEGIDIKQGSHDIKVYQNDVHHLNNRLGIYADAWDVHTYNIDIYQNIIHHCSESGLAIASENGGLIENVTIYNNIIYQNQYGGIELGSWSDIGYPGPKPIEHIKIINNTCYKNGEYNGGWGYGIVIDNPDAKDVIIRNNICSENSAQIAIQQINSGGIVGHNLLYGNNTASGTLYGSNSIVGNPLFMDAISNNFHLSSNSPAINSGSAANAPNFDFDNNSRPSEAGIDIGAYEYVSTLDIQDNTGYNNKIEIYPNPVSNQLNILIDEVNYQNYTLKLFNSNGKLVRKVMMNKLKNDSMTIQRKGLISGLYILNIMTDNKVILNKKLIME